MIDVSELMSQSAHDMKNAQLLLTNSGDKRGGATMNFVESSRDYAISKYFIENNQKSFYETLGTSGQAMIDLFVRESSGKKGLEAWTSLLACDVLLDLLASRNFKLARSYSFLLGVQEHSETDVSEFMIAFAYCLKYAVMDEFSDFEYYCNKLGDIVGKKKFNNFRGYHLVLSSIFDSSVDFENAIQTMVHGHKILTSSRGEMYNTSHELMCIWGVGTINLSLVLNRRQIEFDIDQLIPVRLLGTDELR